MERANQCLINKMTFSESSPEKAGVGGSIPSLATIVVAIIVAFAANGYQLLLFSVRGSNGCRNQRFSR